MSDLVNQNNIISSLSSYDIKYGVNDSMEERFAAWFIETICWRFLSTQGEINVREFNTKLVYKYSPSAPCDE